MPIQVSCECGKKFAVADSFAGKRGKCPACGRVIQVPAAAEAPVGAVVSAALPAAYAADPEEPATTDNNSAPVGAGVLPYAGGGAAGPGGLIAPPEVPIVMPTELPPKLRRPGLPPCHLVFSTQGADINAGFDVAPAFQAFAEAFAKKVKKKYDLQLTPPPAAGAATVFVRIIQMDEGKQWLRYLLGPLLGGLLGGTMFVITTRVTGASGQSQDFDFKQRGWGGFFGGGSLNLLKSTARMLAKKVGKKALQAA